MDKLQNTWKKVVYNLNNTIPHNVHLVNPFSWLLICVFVLQWQWLLTNELWSIGGTIDFQSDAITRWHKPTFDDAIDNTDDTTGITNDMLRMNENTFTFLSPIAQKLHQDISNYSPSKLKMHTQNTIQASWKNMVDNIQYIIKNWNIENNEEVGRWWDQLETFIQKSKMKMQKEAYVTPVKNWLSFPAFDSKKIQANSKIKGNSRVKKSSS